jgi:hypothetical protein
MVQTEIIVHMTQGQFLAHVVQDMSGKGLELIRCLHQPLQHRLGVDREHLRGAPDAQTLG